MLKNAKISVKLGVGFGCLMLIIILISTVATISFASIKEVEEQMLHRNLQKIILSNNVAGAIRQQVINYGNIHAGGDIRAIRQYILSVDTGARENVGLLSGMIDQDNAEEMYFWGEFQRLRAPFNIARTNLDGYLDDEDVEGFQANFMGVFDVAAENYVNSVQAYVNYTRDDAIAFGEKMEAITERDMMVVITIAVIGLLLAFVLATIISKMITKPLAQCLYYVHSIEQGNTDVKIKADSTDEIGELCVAMQHMAGSIQRMYQDALYIEREIVAGHLKKRADESKHKGDYLKIIGTFNDLLNVVTNAIDESMTVMAKLSHKDLTARVKGDYRGDLMAFAEQVNLAGEMLKDALVHVDATAGQINTITEEITVGSVKLAEAASEQASSLEEISSSLKVINSLTGNNADNAKSGSKLAEQAVFAVEAGNEAMEKMNKAMDAIMKSSRETGMILKTIDEIAFQTNLLALNAAVEAAHAGDVGKGFAVVAEEVKNLALRSAEAAKNTNVLVDESIKNSEMGSKIVEQVTKSFIEMKDQFGKVKDIVNEISASSDEQAQGVNHISTGIDEMNRVTQINAANAEESAAATTELNSQTTDLRDMVASFNLGSRSGYGKTISRVAQLTNNKRRIPAQLPQNIPQNALEVKPNTMLSLDGLEAEF